jgi:hypothetical protein
MFTRTAYVSQQGKREPGNTFKKRSPGGGWEPATDEDIDSYFQANPGARVYADRVIAEAPPSSILSSELVSDPPGSDDAETVDQDRDPWFDNPDAYTTRPPTQDEVARSGLVEEPRRDEELEPVTALEDVEPSAGVAESVDPSPITRPGSARALPMSADRARLINQLSEQVPESEDLNALAAELVHRDMEQSDLSQRERAVREQVQRQITIGVMQHTIAALALERAERDGRPTPTAADLQREQSMFQLHADSIRERDRDAEINLPGEHDRLVREATEGSRRSVVLDQDAGVPIAGPGEQLTVGHLVHEDALDEAARNAETPAFSDHLVTGEIDRVQLAMLPGLDSYQLTPAALRVVGMELNGSDGSRYEVYEYDADTDTARVDIVRDGEVLPDQQILISDLEPRQVREARAWADSLPGRALSAYEAALATGGPPAVLPADDPLRQDRDVAIVLTSPRIPEGIREQVAAAFAGVVDAERDRARQDLADSRSLDEGDGDSQPVTAQVNQDFHAERLGNLQHLLDPNDSRDKPLLAYAEKMANEQALRDEALKDVAPEIYQRAALLVDSESARSGKDIGLDTIDEAALAMRRHQLEFFARQQTVPHKLARLIGLEGDTPTTGLEAMGISPETVEQNKDMLAAAATYRGEELDEETLQREAEALTWRAHVQEGQWSMVDQYESHQARLARREAASQVDHKGLINSAHETAGSLIDPSKAQSTEGKAFAELGKALAFFGILTGSAVVKGAQATVQLREQRRQRDQSRGDVEVPQYLLDQGYTEENYADIRAMVRADAWRQHQDGLRDSPEPTQLYINDSAEFDLQYRQLMAEAEAQRQQELAEQLAHEQQLREQELQGPSLERSI